MTMEADRIMSNNEEILARHDAAIAKQMRQTAEALGKVQQAVDNLGLSEAKVAELQAALNEATASNAAFSAGVEAGTDVLDSDDPAPEPPPGG